MLDTDEPRFGGFGLVENRQPFETFAFNDGEHNRHQIHIYIPARTGLVLERI